MLVKVFASLLSSLLAFRLFSCAPIGYVGKSIEARRFAEDTRTGFGNNKKIAEVGHLLER
jgi:hypothetical protein